MQPRIAVILTNAERQILWVNDEFSLITGYSLGEVVGKKPSLLQGPKSQQPVVERIRKALSQHIPVKEDIINYRKNGAYYHCRLVIYPVFDIEGTLTNFIAFEADLAELKGQEEPPLLQLRSKYSSSHLKQGDEMRLFHELKNTLEEKRLYLIPDLKLSDLSSILSTNTKYLSQVINSQAGMNFIQFINEYRIKKVLEAFKSGTQEQLTLFGIGLQCGFKNKSTFFKVFKESTGMTPQGVFAIEWRVL